MRYLPFAICHLPCLCKKTLSVLLSAALVWTSGGVMEAAAGAPEVFVGPSNLPQFQLQPPGQLGRIADYYNTERESGRAGERAKQQEEASPLVILIQDLHAHYGVQKNIAGLLDFLSEKLPKTSFPAGSGGGTNIDDGSPTTSHSNELIGRDSPPDARGTTSGMTAREVPFALAVEGASGPIDSSVMALFPDEKIRLAASDYLMKEGELTGAEYFAIQRGIPNLLVGVENETYYTVHRDLFRKTLEDRNEMVKSLKAIQRDIAHLPRRVFRKNKALREFQKKVDAYEKGEMGTHGFVGLLVQEAARLSDQAIKRLGDGKTSTQSRRLPESPNRPIAPFIDLKRDFPTLAAFAANSRFGTMEQIRTATAAFLTQIQNHLSAQEKADLKLLAKNKGTTTYYLYLRDLIYKKRLFLAVPSELAQYLEYIHIAQTMGMDRVIHEAKELAFRIKLALASNGETVSRRNGEPAKKQEDVAPSRRLADSPSRNAAVDLVQVQHDLDLLLRLSDLQASEHEVRDFAPRLNQFVALTKALVGQKGSHFDEPTIRRLISSSIDFYVMALIRNKPMVDNTLRLLQAPGSGLPGASSQEPRAAVLVAGGFHTAQLTQMLRARNVSYLVITPDVDRVTDDDHELYVKRLAGEILTEEEILASAKMGPEPLSGKGLTRFMPAVDRFKQFFESKKDQRRTSGRTDVEALRAQLVELRDALDAYAASSDTLPTSQRQELATRIQSSLSLPSFQSSSFPFESGQTTTETTNNVKPDKNIKTLSQGLSLLNASLINAADKATMEKFMRPDEIRSLLLAVKKSLSRAIDTLTIPDSPSTVNDRLAVGLYGCLLLALPWSQAALVRAPPKDMPAIVQRVEQNLASRPEGLAIFRQAQAAVAAAQAPLPKVPGPNLEEKPLAGTGLGVATAARPGDKKASSTGGPWLRGFVLWALLGWTALTGVQPVTLPAQEVGVPAETLSGGIVSSERNNPPVSSRGTLQERALELSGTSGHTYPRHSSPSLGYTNKPIMAVASMANIKRLLALIEKSAKNLLVKAAATSILKISNNVLATIRRRASDQTLEGSAQRSLTPPRSRVNPAARPGGEQSLTFILTRLRGNRAAAKRKTELSRKMQLTRDERIELFILTGKSPALQAEFRDRHGRAMTSREMRRWGRSVWVQEYYAPEAEVRVMMRAPVLFAVAHNLTEWLPLLRSPRRWWWTLQERVKGARDIRQDTWETFWTVAATSARDAVEDALATLDGNLRARILDGTADSWAQWHAARRFEDLNRKAFQAAAAFDAAREANIKGHYDHNRAHRLGGGALTVGTTIAQARRFLKAFMRADLETQWEEFDKRFVRLFTKELATDAEWKRGAFPVFFRALQELQIPAAEATRKLEEDEGAVVRLPLAINDLREMINSIGERDMLIFSNGSETYMLTLPGKKLDWGEGEIFRHPNMDDLVNWNGHSHPRLTDAILSDSDEKNANLRRPWGADYNGFVICLTEIPGEMSLSVYRKGAKDYSTYEGQAAVDKAIEIGLLESGARADTPYSADLHKGFSKRRPAARPLDRAQDEPASGQTSRGPIRDLIITVLLVGMTLLGVSRPAGAAWMGNGEGAFRDGQGQEIMLSDGRAKTETRLSGGNASSRDSDQRPTGPRQFPQGSTSLWQRSLQSPLISSDANNKPAQNPRTAPPTKVTRQGRESRKNTSLPTIPASITTGAFWKNLASQAFLGPVKNLSELDDSPVISDVSVTDLPESVNRPPAALPGGSNRGTGAKMIALAAFAGLLLALFSGEIAAYFQGVQQTMAATREVQASAGGILGGALATLAGLISLSDPADRRTLEPSDPSRNPPDKPYPGRQFTMIDELGSVTYMLGERTDAGTWRAFVWRRGRWVETDEFPEAEALRIISGSNREGAESAARGSQPTRLTGEEPGALPRPRAQAASAPDRKNGRAEPGGAPASLAYWIARAVWGDHAMAAKWGRRWLGYKGEDVLGAAIAVVCWFLPPIALLVLALEAAHLPFMIWAAIKESRAPPKDGRPLVTFRGAMAQAGILGIYGVPGIATALSLPLDLALPLLFLSLVLGPTLHTRYDERLFGMKGGKVVAIRAPQSVLLTRRKLLRLAALAAGIVTGAAIVNRLPRFFMNRAKRANAQALQELYAHHDRLVKIERRGQAVDASALNDFAEKLRSLYVYLPEELPHARNFGWLVRDLRQRLRLEKDNPPEIIMIYIKRLHEMIQESSTTPLPRGPPKKPEPVVWVAAGPAPSRALRPETGVGQHAVGGEDFTDAQARELADEARKRSDVKLADKKQRQAWAEAIKQLLADGDQPGSVAHALFNAWPELSRELEALAPLLRSPSKSINIGGKAYTVNIHHAPTHSPAFQTADGLTKTGAFGVRNDATGTISLYVHDFAGLIHEGLEHAIFPTLLKDRLIPIDHSFNQRHTLAFFAEALAGGEIETVTLDDGRMVTVVIPSRALNELSAMSQSQLDRFIGIYDAVLANISTRKFSDEGRQTYALAMAKALHERADGLLRSGAGTPPPQGLFPAPERPPIMIKSRLDNKVESVDLAELPAGAVVQFEVTAMSEYGVPYSYTVQKLNDKDLLLWITGRRFFDERPHAIKIALTTFQEINSGRSIVAVEQYVLMPDFHADHHVDNKVRADYPVYIEVFADSIEVEKAVLEQYPLVHDSLRRARSATRGGRGMHRVDGDDLTLEELNTLKKQAALEAGFEDRVRWANRIREARRADGERDIAALGLAPFVDELDRLLRSKDPEVFVAGEHHLAGRRYKIVFRKAPRWARSYQKLGVDEPRAAGERDDRARTITIYLHDDDIAAVLHEGLEHAIFPQHKSIKPRQRHPLAHWAEALIGTRWGIPLRVNAQLEAMTPAQLRTFLMNDHRAVSEMEARFGAPEDRIRREQVLKRVRRLHVRARRLYLERTAHFEGGSKVDSTTRELNPAYRENSIRRSGGLTDGNAVALKGQIGWLRQQGTVLGNGDKPYAGLEFSISDELGSVHYKIGNRTGPHQWSAFRLNPAGQWVETQGFSEVEIRRALRGESVPGTDAAGDPVARGGGNAAFGDPRFEDADATPVLQERFGAQSADAFRDYTWQDWIKGFLDDDVANAQIPEDDPAYADLRAALLEAIGKDSFFLVLQQMLRRASFLFIQTENGLFERKRADDTKTYAAALHGFGGQYRSNSPSVYFSVLNAKNLTSHFNEAQMSAMAVHELVHLVVRDMTAKGQLISRFSPGEVHAFASAVHRGIEAKRLSQGETGIDAAYVEVRNRVTEGTFGAWGRRLPKGEMDGNSRDNGGIAEASIDTDYLLTLMGTKYGARKLAEGGPVQQPEVIAIFEESENVLSQMQSETADPVERINQPLLLFASPGDKRSFREIAVGIAAGSLPLPAIYKPNGGGVGHGIVFIERKDENIVLSMIHDQKHQKDGQDPSARVREHLAPLGIPSRLDEQSSVVTITLDPARLQVADVLEGIWQTVSRSGKNSYDAGMMERVLPLVKIGNRSYETRHYWRGRLTTQDAFRLLKEDYHDGDTKIVDGSFARIGASGYFANRGGRAEAEKLPYPKIYDPLLGQFNVSETRKKEFERYVDEKLQSLLHHIRNRLLQLGLAPPAEHDALEGEIDFFWLAPTLDSNGFPVPFLNEMKIYMPERHRFPKTTLRVDGFDGLQKKSAPGTDAKSGGANWLAGWVSPKLSALYSVFAAWFFESTGLLELAREWQAPLGLDLPSFAFMAAMLYWLPKFLQLLKNREGSLRERTNAFSYETGIMVLLTFAATLLVGDGGWLAETHARAVTGALGLIHALLNARVYRKELEGLVGFGARSLQTTNGATLDGGILNEIAPMMREVNPIRAELTKPRSYFGFSA